MDAPGEFRFHALLIGIDDYGDNSLTGCVADIDDIATFLTERLRVPPGCIRKLVAPAQDCGRSISSNEQAPTHAGIIAALRTLASDAVQEGDRVFIYYSGHGSFVRSPEAQAYHEGLVPMDYQQSGLLFDFELNRLLQAIAQRSHDLTCILDCCHSAGSTRELLAQRVTGRTRFLPTECIPTHRGILEQREPRMITEVQSATQAVGPQAYTVVAACHADERAKECRLPVEDGRSHGVLSYCLLDILQRVEVDRLHKLRWGEIWESLKAAVQVLNPLQRPQILGLRERRIFGGPWTPYDMGFPMHRNTDGSYSIAAGTLAGLGAGAEIGVYGPEPACFPHLDTDADKQACRGVLRVDRVTPASAIARPVSVSPAIDLSGVIRGRLLRFGIPEQLRVALTENVSAEVRHALAELQGSDQFRVIDARNESPEAFVGQDGNGDLWIGDDVFAGDDCSSPGALARISFEEAQTLPRLSSALRAGLNHYAQYVVPLRIYRNGGYSLPPDAIEVRLFDCTGLGQGELQRLEQDATLRRESPKDAHGRYSVHCGDHGVLHVTNRLPLTTLSLFLVICNLDGQVQLLDNDVTLMPRSGKLFWADGVAGQPFEFSLDANQRLRWGMDRVLVIATDQKGLDLQTLIQQHTMQEVIDATLCGRTFRASTVTNPAGTRWMAVQTLVRIGRNDVPE